MGMDAIVIAVNLGRLKAWRMLPTPTRGAKLELFEGLDFPEAHGRLADKVTDVAGRYHGRVPGRFPSSDNAGLGTQISAAEALKAQLEMDRRLVKLIAEQIETILIRERPEQWHLAATSEIFHAIVAEIDPPLRERLVRSIYADLTKVPPAKVLEQIERR